jgi:hypothetical protein
MARTHRWYAFIAVALTALAIAIIVRLTSPIPSREVTSVRSPYLVEDAVVFDVPKDAHGSHSCSVCVCGIGHAANSTAGCRLIAYLSGVSACDASKNIRVAWLNRTQIEVRYVAATSVRVYKGLRSAWAKHVVSIDDPS